MCIYIYIYIHTAYIKTDFLKSLLLNSVIDVTHNHLLLRLSSACGLKFRGSGFTFP